MFEKSADKVVFVDDALERAFEFLSEDDWLKKVIRGAIDEIKINVFCGQKIKKELIPKEYINKYGIDNLYWYRLPKGWRLVYSVMSLRAEETIKILAVIIEYFDHKKYERRFNY